MNKQSIKVLLVSFLASSSVFALSPRQQATAPTPVPVPAAPSQNPQTNQQQPLALPPSIVQQPSSSSLPSFSPIVERLLPSAVSVIAVTTPESNIRGKYGKDGEETFSFSHGSPFEDLLKEFFKNYFDQARRPQKALGSGFIIKVTDQEVFVVTNYHVVREAKKITIILDDKTELQGTLQGSDERTDIAVIKIVLEGQNVKKERLVAAEWGSSEELRIGDWAIAIGNPFGLGNSATFGPISSHKGRDLIFTNRDNKRGADFVDDFIQHQAPINVGNSGGPLFNLKGGIIGINTAIFTPSGGNVGVGFAIPSAVAKKAVDQIISFGRTKRGWLGLRIQQVTPEMAEGLAFEDLGLKDSRGAIISSLTKDGPAEKAGLQKGDIIVEYDGKPLNDQTRLSRQVGDTQVGKNITLKAVRQGKILEFKVVVGEFETAEKPEDKTEESKKTSEPSKAKKLEILGLTLTHIPEKIRTELKIDNEGVYVSGLDMRQETNLIPGDIIEFCKIPKGSGSEEQQIDFKKLDDFEEAVKRARQLKLKNLFLSIKRNKDSLFMTINIEEEIPAAAPAA